MTDLEAVLKAVDDAADEMIAFTGKLVATESVTGSEGAAAELVAEWLTANRIACEVKHVAPELIERYPALAHEQDLDRRPNVVGHLPGADPAPLVLNGHIDVVPVDDADSWQQPPFGGNVSGGRLWGRGSADMKGGLVAGMFALRAVRDANIKLHHSIDIQAVMAEETGGLGTLALLESELRPVGAIVLEPTDLIAAPACGGIVQFTITAVGRAAHTAVPWGGVSAIEKLWLIYEGLNAAVAARNSTLSHPLFDRLPVPAPWGIGTVSAGSWRSTIPDHAEMSGRVGLMPDESIADGRRFISATVAQIAAGDPWLKANRPAIEWIHEGFPSWETASDDRLVTAMTEALAATGGGTVGAVTYGSDAGHFARAGIPVMLYGPGRIEVAHMTDENVLVDDLKRATRVLAATIVAYNEGGK